jgi:hypothetical protein
LQIGVGGGLVGGLAGSSGPSGGTRFLVDWDGDKLVIKRGVYSGPTPESGSFSEHIEVWALNPPDMLAITVTDRVLQQPGTATLTYRKR